jgi:hypothetical protein
MYLELEIKEKFRGGGGDAKQMARVGRYREPHKPPMKILKRTGTHSQQGYLITFLIKFKETHTRTQAHTHAHTHTHTYTLGYSYKDCFYDIQVYFAICSDTFSRIVC